MSFNWTQLVVDHDHVHIATLGVSSVVTLSMGLYARMKLGKGEAAVVPANKVSLRGIHELITEFIAKLAHSIIGHGSEKYVPYFCAIFSFILINNLIGIIPGMSPATENLNTTLAFGLVSFITYNLVGLKEGGMHYLKHFLGPIWWLIPLMLPLEIISHLVRPITLGMRLANVMKGDHTVMSIFLGIVKYPLLIPIPLYLLGLLVCFIQAYVFTLLSMVYISLAKASDH